MKFKVLFLLIAITLISVGSNAQRGVRIGYVDTEYILANFSEYKQAQSALDKKVATWKSDIEKKLNEIELKKTELENESILLTKELYDERIEDIAFEETEILEYQQKLFGPDGALMTQKRQLIQPIQDQIFAAIQDIAKNKKFDFIFDKSADVVMLYTNIAYDVSDRVLKTISRASNRKQAETKKDRKTLKDEELIPGVDKEKEARQKALDSNKAEIESKLKSKREKRLKELEERRKQQQKLRESRKQEAEKRRQKINENRKQKINEGRKKEISKKENIKTNNDTIVKKNSIDGEIKNTKTKTASELLEERKQQRIKDKEAREKAIQEKRKKIIAAKKKARDERLQKLRNRDSLVKAKINNKQ